MPLLLTDLPEDALIDVLSRVHDLHAAASTCTRFRDLCRDEAVLRLFFTRGARCAANVWGERPSLAPAPSVADREHPLTRELRATPPLFAALKWRAVSRNFNDPQRLAEFCCALIDALTPVGNARDARRRRRGNDAATDPTTLRPLPCPRNGKRGPPVPGCAALMGCDAPYARPFLHAALAHCRAERPLHALVALASALPPVLQPLLLPALVTGGHAEAALRLLEAEGCLDQPGCLGGRFDLDLGAGAGPGALLPADAPLLPRLRACARQATSASQTRLIPGEEDWWWWWLPPGVAEGAEAAVAPGAGAGAAGPSAAAATATANTATTARLFARRAPEDEARLLRELAATGLRCLRWAVWEPVRLGDRPPPGLGPCAGGGARRAVVGPLAMATAAAVKLVATGGDSTARPGPPAAAADASARLLWSLTEATMFARLFRHHVPGPWWRRSPLLLRPAAAPVQQQQEEGPGPALGAGAGGGGPAVAQEQEVGTEFLGAHNDDDDDDGKEEAHTAQEASGSGSGSDEDDDDDDFDVGDDEADFVGELGEGAPDEDEGGDAPYHAPTHPPFGQRRLHERPEDRCALWRWRGRAVFAPGASSSSPTSPPPPSRPLPPWCRVVSRLNKASWASTWSRIPAAGANATAATAGSGRPVAPASRRSVVGSVLLAVARPLYEGSAPSSYAPRTVSADPVGAVFGPADDPLALPALVEMAACAGGAARLRDAWAAAGGERGRALFVRSVQKSRHLMAALALGGAAAAAAKGGKGGAEEEEEDKEDDDNDDAAIFRDGLRGGFWNARVFNAFSGCLPALCAAGEAGNTGAMRLLLASREARYGELSLALARACGGALYRLGPTDLTLFAHEGAWHPAGATLCQALAPPSSREWPEETLSLLLDALTGAQYREEAAEALCPALRMCLLRRPADRERTFALVWAALDAVPVAAEQLASRTGHRRAPTSGSGAGGVEGFGEPSSILALLARRGDTERVRWALKVAPTVAFRAREYPILLARERGYEDLAQLLLDAPRVAEGVVERGQLRGGKQAQARARVFEAARLADVGALRKALRDVEIDASRNGWWSPLLAEMIASTAAAAAREGPPRPDEEDWDERARFRLDMPLSANWGPWGREAAARAGPYTLLLTPLLRHAARKLAPEDAYAATLGVALGRGFGGRRWGPRPARPGDADDAAEQRQEQEETQRRGLRLPSLIADCTRQAASSLCVANPGQPAHGTAFGALRPLIVAALLADGSPRALDAVGRLEDEPVDYPPGALSRSNAPPGPAPFSLGLDVGLILARTCQLPWPVPAVRHGNIIVDAGSRLDNGTVSRCAGPADGWCVPTEHPFPAESVLAAACRPGRALALALREARAAALAERREGAGQGRGGGGAQDEDDDGGDDDDDDDEDSAELPQVPLDELLDDLEGLELADDDDEDAAAGGAGGGGGGGDVDMSE
jgi:hypothetical protein